MASASSLARFKGSSAGGSESEGLETIEIDPQFASGLGLSLGDIVEIGLLHDLPIAKSVTTEPYSADDWEIIELHAAYVEQNLLSQVRAASVGQEVDVWIFGRTRARLRVVSFDPAPGKHEAVLLGTDTEVSIAPKRRVNGAEAKQSTSISKSDTDGKRSSEPKILKSLRLRALPSSFFSPSGSVPSEPVALVSIATYWELISTKLPLSESEGFGPINVYRLKASADPLASEPTAPVPAAQQGSKVIHAPEGAQANGSAKPGSEAPSISTNERETVTLCWSREIPDGHVLFLGYDGVKDWNCCILASTPKSKTLRVTEDVSSLKWIDAKRHHDLAGIDDFLEKCSNALQNIHASHNIFDISIPSVQGILITGRPGSGKTSVAKAVAKMVESSFLLAHVIYVDFAKLADERVPRLKAYFRYLYEKAAWQRPTTLVIDNMDKLLSAELEHADSYRSRQLTELFLLHFTHRRTDTRGVSIVATAESDTALHPRVMRSHIFKSTFKLMPPNKDARRDILSQSVRRRTEVAPELTQSAENPINFTALATQTEGYLPTDLNDLVSRAVHEAAIRSNKASLETKEILPVDFEKAQVDFVPLSLRDLKLQKSDVTWSDIGGLRKTKQILRETLEWPTKYAAIFAKCPLRLRSGILLYGYPGCGKTLLASAVARECGLNFISVKGPELLNKYIGASEKSVRDLFERASAAKPCVLFFDEFDSIAPKRGHDSTGVTDRVVNQMLTQMDGAEGLDGVYVLAATSRPDLIDSALLRPGRLDKSLLCDMPDFDERKEILEVISKKVTVSPFVDWDAIALATEGFSGADLQAVIYNAHLDVVHSTLAEKQSSEGKGKGKAKDTGDTGEEEQRIEYVILGGREEDAHRSKAEEAALQKKLQRILANRGAKRSGKEAERPQAIAAAKQVHEITEEHIRRSLTSTRPSVPLEERVRLQLIYSAFVSDRSGEMPVPPESGSVGTRASLM
ncbi:AAA-domain-containing protein [Fomitiporia mediterranea MF3/22]|uniref:AAA-domain-containing protein n=1 Tax=Fomitiporia mediterranea (strain MF3/22) TaxID=694068 RepID=UPI000440854F|nr:AAA-domain-containing protein [Fomitiporia mediterranea MF3/22]EJC98437.1 AAA-domain-containing protein [Fomitiporia mediterranea MF3/22]